MQWLIFNPENDLALASGDPHYTPPASARLMASDLKDLPRLWAQADDVVVDMQQLPQLLATSPPPHRILPWGWSPLLVQRLRDGGVPAILLPTDEQMSAYRTASSRQTGVQLLSEVRRRLKDEPLIIGEAAWCTQEEDVWALHKQYDGTMLKAPWSGSGRGVHPVQGTPTEKDIAWTRRIIALQGGVEVEPIYYNKVYDLALEYWVEPDTTANDATHIVRYEGLSLFETTKGGVYAGNLVAEEQEKEARIGQWIPLPLLHRVRDVLADIIAHQGLASWYAGPIGVDMMIMDGSRLHPLVELNHRMTMGWVACQLSRRQRGITHFSISHEAGHYQAAMT